MLITGVGTRGHVTGCAQVLRVGTSSGASLAAIAQKPSEPPAGSRVLGFNYDAGQRYLSIEGFLP